MELCSHLADVGLLWYIVVMEQNNCGLLFRSISGYKDLTYSDIQFRSGQVRIIGIMDGKESNIEFFGMRKTYIGRGVSRGQYRSYESQKTLYWPTDHPLFFIFSTHLFIIKIKMTNLHCKFIAIILWFRIIKVRYTCRSFLWGSNKWWTIPVLCPVVPQQPFSWNIVF